MSDYMIVNGELRHADDELKHYGVLGMKWGIRRARKKGVDYTYKSHGQKKYEKRLTKQQNRGSSEKRIAKTTAKLEMYKQRDRNRQDYASQTSLGKSVAKQILFGPFGSGNYSRMRSAGSGRLVSAFASNWLSSTVGLPVTVLLSRSVEKGTANREVRFRNQLKNGK